MPATTSRRSRPIEAAREIRAEAARRYGPYGGQQPHPGEIAFVKGAEWADERHAAEVERLLDSVREIKRRLTDRDGYGDSDVIRFALQHISAIEGGRANPPRVAQDGESGV